ncbi:protein ENHANCED DOWNY MILDEW 2-like [Salvia miltiorrhiza]|uniref:protein ENHANCED DOWNY MILDEW 2-like n=1 Tax=Salvia miltiorrhiza TaxID=226208 RepID=UPI0025AC738E|nr:protein ENHANCED DOWNY MILDEW 2-like [Salvia miltiorrhiza]
MGCYKAHFDDGSPRKPKSEQRHVTSSFWHYHCQPAKPNQSNRTYSLTLDQPNSILYSQHTPQAARLSGRITIYIFARATFALPCRSSMALSDEEGEIALDCATNYFLVDSKENPISFSSLPLIWNDSEGEEHGQRVTAPTEPVYLRGAVHDGCRKIYTKVIGWKFVLSYVLPEIYVLRDSKFGRWIKLHKPRKGYESTVRTALITIHCLHFIKKSSKEISGEDLWKHLGKTFSTYEDPPSENDLASHLQLMKEAALRDKDIAQTKNLHAFLSQIPGKRKAFCQENMTRKKAKFIVDDDDDDANIDAHNNLSDEDHDELFDNVCAYCDDGGDVLGCEGRCIRSFHATIESGADSKCESLCYSSDQVQAMDTFLCRNCKYQQHQCFICGRLGNSDKSSGAEVFPCVSATCGHFYHPECLSKLLFPRDDYQAQVFQNKIKAGDSFTCPAHKCHICKQGEDKKFPEMQFAICRRCPKAYHRKCLPSTILFHQDDANKVPQRAWTGLLNKRILIYCRDHKICRKLLTPRRDHLLFPNDDGKGGQHSTRSKAFGILPDEDKVEQHSKGTSGDILSGGPINKNRKNLPGNVSKQNLSSSRMNVGPPSRSLKEPSAIKNNQISGKRMSISSMKRIPEKAAAENVPIGNAATLRTAEMRHRIQKLMEESISSFNKEEFLGDQRRKCSHESTYFQVNKTITLGKIELSVQAMRGAVQKLQEGGTVKDAKDVCEPAVLTQMIKWKRKLAVYLAPFIHGVRYTSFGRHFTNVDKLKQVVNRLRWYVQDGDMIVDFSCGSNDFSCFMKEELDRMGKECSFKNYDIIQTRNDFNFEKRDWMTVSPEELPEGSKLIIGLNPPFGVQASHANQFINKALTFKPKLLILIVPKETERLDRKKSPYDLIWEDDRILSGKSFYLPGSVDVHDQQLEQWNLDTPPLYLWSRPDWTARHKQVAVERSHLIENQGVGASAVSNYLMEENQDCYGDFSSVAAGYSDINRILEEVPEPTDDL